MKALSVSTDVPQDTSRLLGLGFGVRVHLQFLGYEIFFWLELGLGFAKKLSCQNFTLIIKLF